MTETMRDRIEVLLARRQWKPADLARAYGATPQAVTDLLATASTDRMQEPTVARLAEVLGVERAWLRYGGVPTSGYWEGAFRAVARMQAKLGELSGEFAEEATPRAGAGDDPDAGAASAGAPRAPSPPPHAKAPAARRRPRAAEG